MKIRKLIEDYLKEAKILQVATSRNDQPWACTVYFAYDKDLNLYWISKSARRHSIELRDNENVSGVIVLPHTPGDKVRGIQLEGAGKELSGDEAREGMGYYSDRFGIDKENVSAILDGSDGHVCYKIIPRLYVLFDEVNYPDDPRREYKL